MNWPRVPAWRLSALLALAVLTAGCTGASIVPAASSAAVSPVVVGSPSATAQSSGVPSPVVGSTSPTTTTITLVPGSSSAAASVPPTIPSPTATAPPAAAHNVPPGLGRIAGRVTAAPICPVVTVPPNPSCAPRVVAGAVIVAVDGAGVVAQATSAANGSYTLGLAPGSYTIEARPVAGIMRTPPPAHATVRAAGDLVTVDFQYDTGIR